MLVCSRYNVCQELAKLGTMGGRPLAEIEANFRNISRNILTIGQTLYHNRVRIWSRTVKCVGDDCLTVNNQEMIFILILTVNNREMIFFEKSL